MLTQNKQQTITIYSKVTEAVSDKTNKERIGLPSCNYNAVMLIFMFL